jgi:hypothetical protein
MSNKQGNWGVRFYSHTVNSAGAVCDQKISKFFVSSGEESMAGHVGVNGVY